jgi:CYTH domain
MPTELEAKLIAPGELRLPDLSGLVKAATAVRLPDRHLEAIYYDTAGFGLVRNRITLRCRSGEDGPPWTVKLPVAEAWLRNTGAALTPACVAAGELITSVRLDRARLRSKWPKAWKRASARKLRRWW